MVAAIQLSSGALVGGDFRVIEPLAAGGMGAVYIAEQLSTGKRRALKVMHAGLMQDPKLRERFEREARVGALVASDHVVDVVAAGVDANGTPWIAMELLEGDDLAAYVRKQGRLPREEVREIVRQLGHALAKAHEAGVVHRDLKPENVFLAKSRTAEGKRTVKVLDFGIAKLVASARTTATVPMGTPAWMSPEQTDPRAAITPASDVWALGLIAFWLLTGRPYWNCALDPGASIHAILREILFEDLEPASRRARGKGATGALPAGFDAWFSRSLAREPKARFADAGAQLAALEALLDAPSAGEEGASAATAPDLTVEEAGAMSTRSFVEVAGLVGSGELGQATEPQARGSAETLPASPAERDTVEAPAPSGAEREGAGAPTTAELDRKATTSPRRDDASKAAEPSAAPEAPAAAPRSNAKFVGIAIVAAAALYAAARLGALEARPAIAPVASADSVAPTAATSAPPAAASAAPSATASAEGPTAASASEHATHAGSGAHHPAATATPVASAAPGPGPFDLRMAQQVLQQVGSSARFICKDREGPKALSATVIFQPGGGVQRVEMDPMTRNSGTGFCWSGILFSAHVSPFSGPPQAVPAAIALE